MSSGTNVYRMGLEGSSFQGPFPMWSLTANSKNPAWNIP